MVPTPTYTEVDIVKERLNQISGANLLASGAICRMINQAEGVVDGVMRLTGRGSSTDYTFDADKHGIVRDTTTALAAFMCLNFDITEAGSTVAASLMGDMLWAEADRGLAVLSDDRVRRWVQGV